MRLGGDGKAIKREGMELDMYADLIGGLKLIGEAMGDDEMTRNCDAIGSVLRTMQRPDDPGLTLTEYQRLAQRTANETEQEKKLDNGILGLCGEVGEIADQIKKYRHQGHELDKAHMIEELGDVLWYCAELAAGLGVGLAEVAERNIDKLRKRYPDGFDAERSKNR